MRIDKVLQVLLIAGMAYGCNQETVPMEPNKFTGLWSLYIIEQQDSITGEWSELGNGLQGYILYDEKDNMAVHLTSKGYEETDLRFPNFEDSISTEALKYLTNSYVYFAKYTVDVDQKVVEHARISHSNPGQWNEIAKRSYTFSGDTLTLQPLENPVVRLKWIKKPVSNKK